MNHIVSHIIKSFSRHAEKVQRLVVGVLCCVMLYPTEVMAAIENNAHIDAIMARQIESESTQNQNNQSLQNEAEPQSSQDEEPQQASEQEPMSIQSSPQISDMTPQELEEANQQGAKKVQSVSESLDDRQPLVVDASENQVEEGDSVLVVVTADGVPAEFNAKRVFNPDPTRAVWMSVLCPGLGQIYNRRYWKLPIVVGGFVGLGYATAWNNNQLQDYTQGYRDLTDSDPSTDSYMNFFPPNAQESDFDKSWLTNTMKSRKDYYRRNRDLCIISLVGLYLLCIVDAYVDASLAHFDITDNLSMDVQPVIINAPKEHNMSVGVNWALNF